MPGYIQKVLHRFQYPPPIRAQYAPHSCNQPIYGATRQYTTDKLDSPNLTPSALKEVQEIIGSLSHYAFAIDNTMLVVLGDLAAAQSQSTDEIWEKIV